MKKQQKAKTAYELLARVCAHIREEPKRYYQESWSILGKKRIAARFNKDTVPACGTMACRAGWIVALHDGPRALTTLKSRNMFHTPIADRANAILGVTPDYTSPLFDGSAVRGHVGTVAYARKGVAGIRAFMKTHRKHLQARTLDGV